MAQRARRRGRVARASREYGKADAAARRADAVRRLAARADRLDEPPRLGRPRRPRARASRPRRRRRRSPPSRTPSAGSTASSSTPRSSHTPHGRTILEELPLRRRRRAADVDAGGRDRGAGRADPRAGRPRARDLRALGRRRLRRRGAARAQGDRRPAHLRLRRPRPPAPGRGRAGGRDVRRPLPRAARPRRRRRSASSRGSPASTEPEEKRKTIGEEFIRVFEEEAARLGDARFLVQGTLYPDVIESGGERRRRREDQVAPQRRRPARGHGVRARRAAAAAVQGRGARASARSSGCRSEMVWRQPFPGPGLAIRIIGEVTRERLDILRAGRRDPAGGDPPRRPLPRALAELRRAAGDPLRRRPGRRAHLRVPDRDPRRHVATTR